MEGGAPARASLARRREFLLTTSAAVGLTTTAAVGTCLMLPLQSFAQQDQIADLIKAIEANIEAANDLLAYVTAKDPVDKKRIYEIASKEYQLRANLASMLRELSVVSQSRLVNKTYADVALIMSEENIKLVPDILQKTDYEELARMPQQVPCDHFRATLFIIIDVVGLREHRELVVELIRGTQIQTLLEELVDGYPGKSWEDIAKKITDIALFICGVEFSGRILRAIGKQALDSMLKRFSLSLVPYAGVIYIVIVIVAAVRKNWDLIVCQ